MYGSTNILSHAFVIFIVNYYVSFKIVNLSGTSLYGNRIKGGAEIILTFLGVDVGRYRGAIYALALATRLQQLCGFCLCMSECMSG